MNADNVPRPLRFLPRASLIKQGFEALCINEFEGMSFEADEQVPDPRQQQRHPRSPRCPLAICLSATIGAPVCMQLA